MSCERSESWRAKQLLLQEVLAARILARRNLRDFVEQAWHIVEPAKPFIPNWHIDAIAEHLEAVTRGQITRLLINIPPGHAKSLLVSVLWPAWIWIQPGNEGGGPKWRGLFSSYAAELAIRDSVKCRYLIESDWYKQGFEPKWKLSGDQNVKSYFLNTEMGFRMALSVTGKTTGYRGDCIVVDDPLNARDQYSEAARREVITWWDNAMSSRLDDMAKGAKVIIMQRLHQQDLSGHVLEQGGYEHLCLPSEFEPERRSTTSLFRDPRTEPGDLLFAKLFPRAVLTQAKKDLGSMNYAGQHQQRPSADEGGVFKRHWWRYWRPRGVWLPAVSVRMPDGSAAEMQPVELPESLDEVIQSWDCAFKDLKTSDYVAGGVWGRKGADRFLLDQKRERLDCPGTMQAIRAMTDKWPAAKAKLVEDKANGPAVIQMLRHEVAGLIPVNPEGGKYSRAAAVSPQVEAGNVYLPHPSLYAWVSDFIEECINFPNWTHDDQVDQMTQALHRFESKKLMGPLRLISIEQSSPYRMQSNTGGEEDY